MITVYGAVPEGPYSWPGPLPDNPSLGELLDTLKSTPTPGASAYRGVNGGAVPARSGRRTP